MSHRTTKSRSVTTDRRVKFAAVGVANTATDFILLNIFTYLFGMPVLVANIFSSGTAMLQSFVLNKKIVFKSAGGNKFKQGGLFLLVTLAGVWGVQSLVIWLAHSPIEWVMAAVIPDARIADFLAVNGVKALATVASLTWNYLLYRSVVFKRSGL